MRCLYRSNVEIFRARQSIQNKDQEIKKLQTELAGFVIKQRQEKESTGIMDVKEPVEVVEDGKKEAKDLLKAEGNGRNTK